MNDLTTPMECPQGYVEGALRVIVKTPNNISPARIFRWVPEHTPCGTKMHAVHANERYRILEAELDSKMRAPRSRRLERCAEVLEATPPHATNLAQFVACPEDHRVARILYEGRMYTRWVPNTTKPDDLVHFWHVSGNTPSQIVSGIVAAVYPHSGSTTARRRSATPVAPTPTLHTPPTTPESPMIDIQHKTFVNGGDIDHMSDAQLFEIIRKTEAEIAQLEAIKNKPKRLQSKIKQLQGGIDAVVALLDSRDAPANVGDITE